MEEPSAKRSRVCPRCPRRAPIGGSGPTLLRDVGPQPETGEPILAGIGRYAPWLRRGETCTSIPEDEDVLTAGINRAEMPIAGKGVREGRARGPKQVLRKFGPHPADGASFWLKTGHYGPFVAHRRRWASLPKEIEAVDLTLEQALALLDPPERWGTRAACEAAGTLDCQGWPSGQASGTSLWHARLKSHQDLRMHGNWPMGSMGVA